MKLPVEGTITQTFDTPCDYINGRTKHEAIDIVTDGQKRIYATAPCIVTKVVDTYDYLPNSGFGNQVWVQFSNGDQYRFCHLSRDSAQALEEGMAFDTGEMIAHTGQSGYRHPITLFHTHWEQYRNGKRIDPLDPANEPPQPKPNYKATMQLFKQAQQMIWTKIDGVTQYWIIWLKDDGSETKRLVTTSKNRCQDIFSAAGKYVRWSTSEQLEILSRLPQGEDFDLNSMIDSHPELLEQ